jgi:ribonucleotide reductase alpha subunit
MIWALGTPIVHERGIGQALFNCAFVSTAEIGDTLTESLRPFLFMMDISMMGVGVGFDVLGEGKISIHRPASANTEHYVIPDSRQGWVCSLEKLLHSYFCHHFGIGTASELTFDYSLIRPAGSPIRGFGGVASGPAPLRELHEELRCVLDAHHGRTISITGIADIMNMIGRQRSSQRTDRTRRSVER